MVQLDKSQEGEAQVKYYTSQERERERCGSRQRGAREVSGQRGVGRSKVSQRGDLGRSAWMEGKGRSVQKAEWGGGVYGSV